MYNSVESTLTYLEDALKILTPDQAENIVHLAVRRLAEYAIMNDIHSFVLGISGGIDSAAVGVIGIKTAEFLKERCDHDVEIHYLFLDVESKIDDLNKARDLSVAFNFRLEERSLTNTYHQALKEIPIPVGHKREKVAKGNIKCRLRMITLYNEAQLTGGIYLDTDDLSEEWMGFWTKHGDEGDVKIIQHLTKDEVYDVAEFLHVPLSILNSAPGDGLGVTSGNLASEQLGLPYMYIDYIISRFIQNGFDINGIFEQMETGKFQRLVRNVARELEVDTEKVNHVLWQALKTAFKRRNGDNVVHLLPSRTEMGLPEPGTDEFNNLYLNAIFN